MEGSEARGMARSVSGVDEYADNGEEYVDGESEGTSRDAPTMLDGPFDRGGAPTTDVCTMGRVDTGLLGRITEGIPLEVVDADVLMEEFDLDKPDKCPGRNEAGIVDV